MTNHHGRKVDVGWGGQHFSIADGVGVWGSG